MRIIYLAMMRNYIQFIAISNTMTKALLFIKHYLIINNDFW